MYLVRVYNVAGSRQVAIINQQNNERMKMTRDNKRWMTGFVFCVGINVLAPPHTIIAQQNMTES